MIIVDEKYLLHESGICEEGCPWCELEDELIEDYSSFDKKKEKQAKVAKGQKAIKKV